MPKPFIATLAVLSLLLGLPCQALASQTPDPRIYVAPMFSMAFAQSSSLNPGDNLGGVQLSLGKNFGSYFALELYGFYFNDTPLDEDLGSSANMDTFGYGISALFFPARDILPIYAVVGAGLGQNDFDQFSPTVAVNDQSSDFYDLGVGLQFPLGNWGLMLRAEYRYRSTDTDADAENGEFHFRDNILSVGLQLPLGAQPEPQPTPEPAPEPAPAPVQPLDSDGDGDGVIDANDQCPATPRGVEVNASGCPVEKQAPVVLRGVTFEFDSAKLTAQAENRLNNVVAALKASQSVQFSIAGHTDAVGSDAYNQDLSERRAQSVKAYLVEHGIQANRITSVTGYGESRPVATNETAAGRAQNRRVELNVTSQ